MSVTIQDDMWRSAESMTGKQGDDFLLALVRYGFTGEEPKPSSRIYPAFVLCRERISMSADASSKGRKMADARWNKQNAQWQTKHDATASDKHDATASDKHDAEVRRGEESRGEVRREEERTRSEHVAQIITYLNEVCGTSYKPNSETSMKYVGARLADGFTVDDCRRVIDNMAAAWLGDAKMRAYLRPTTLFRKEKFEGYLNRVPEVSSYADYD